MLQHVVAMCCFRCTVPISLYTSTDGASCCVPNEGDFLQSMRTFLVTLQCCALPQHLQRLTDIDGDDEGSIFLKIYGGICELRTKLRRSLQALARDIIESLEADHVTYVTIFGDMVALDFAAVLGCVYFVFTCFICFHCFLPRRALWWKISPP